MALVLLIWHALLLVATAMQPITLHRPAGMQPIPLRSKFGAYLKELIATNGMASPRRLFKRGDGANATAAPVTLFRDSAWVGIIGLGTPQQPMKVLFDTGSSELWVRSTLCQVSACTEQSLHDNIIDTHAFNVNASSTFRFTERNETDGRLRIHRIQYGTGSVLFTPASDTLHLEYETNGPVVENQAFGVSVDQSYFPFATLDLDGIFGLGFKSLSSRGVTPPLQMLTEQKQISKRVFSYRISHKDSGNGTESAREDKAERVVLGNGKQLTLSSDDIGKLYVGGWNESDFEGPINWIPLTRAMFWQATLVGVRYGDQQLTMPEVNAVHSIQNLTAPHQTSPQAIFDTGTSMLIFPKMLAKQLSKAMSGFRLFKFIIIRCKRLPELKPITLTFKALREGNATEPETHDFVIHPRQYMLHKDRQLGFLGFCMSLLGSEDITPTASDLPVTLVGETFLRNFYSVWDEETPRLGLANLK